MKEINNGAAEIQKELMQTLNNFLLRARIDNPKIDVLEKRSIERDLITQKIDLKSKEELASDIKDLSKNFENFTDEERNEIFEWWSKNCERLDSKDSGFLYNLFIC